MCLNIFHVFLRKKDNTRSGKRSPRTSHMFYLKRKAEKAEAANHGLLKKLALLQQTPKMPAAKFSTARKQLLLVEPEPVVEMDGEETEFLVTNEARKRCQVCSAADFDSKTNYSKTVNRYQRWSAADFDSKTIYSKTLNRYQ